jgi:tetratricopeptide (TPR) repeat protein
MEATRDTHAARRRSTLLLVVAIAAGLLVARAAPAAADPKDDAKKLLGKGDELLKKGDYYAKRKKPDKAVAEYERALAAYQLAYDLVTDSRIYFPIAAAEEKLGRHLEAVDHYKKVLIEGGETLDETLRERANAGIENLKQFLGVLTLVVVPDDAAITVDGIDVGVSPLPEPQILAPGEHTVAVTAEGYTPYEIKLTLEAGSESERTIELEEIPVIVEPPRKPNKPIPKPIPEPAPSKGMLLGVGGGAVGLGLLGTITGVMAVGKQGTFSDETLTDDERSSARSSGKTLALVTDLSLVASIGLGAYAVYYYYKTYRPADSARKQRNADALVAWKRAQQVRDRGSDDEPTDATLEPDDGDGDAGEPPVDEDEPVEEEPIEEGGGGVDDEDPLGSPKFWFAPFVSGSSAGLALGGSF